MGKIVVNMCLSGRLLVGQEGRSLVLQPGEAVVQDTLRMLRVGADHDVTYINLALPREDFAGGLEALERPLMRIAPTGPIPVLTLDMIHQTWSALARVDTIHHPELQARLGRLLSETLAAPIPDNQRSSSHALAMIYRAKRTAALRVSHSEFSATDLAATMKITPRYLEQLFRRIEDSPADYIRRMRLNIAWDMLNDADCTLQISEIGERVGLGNRSQFSKAIRNTFDMSPSEARAKRMR